MNLIEELYAIQETEGYLPDDHLNALSRRLSVPLFEIEGVASFYPHFRRAPPPRVRVCACRDLSCHLAEEGRLVASLGEICSQREDVEFRAVSCLGRCDRAPACTVNDVPVDPKKVLHYLDHPEDLPPHEPTESPRSWKCDPAAAGGERYGVARERIAKGDKGSVVEALKSSGLRGLGGAGFPTGMKWDLVRKEPALPKFIVCNADESEPGTFKDRVILEELPHLVLEGMILGAWVVGANKGWIYIRHEYDKEKKALQRAIDEAYRIGALGESVLGSDFSFDVELFVSPGGYILGEETALLEALEGKRGEPRNKPPYPGQKGLFGKPTLMNNVETLALVPHVVQTGKADLKFFSVSGDVTEPGVHLVSVGTTLADLVERCGGMREGKPLLAFLPGGASTEFLTAESADVVMDWEPLKKAGSSLGSGAVVVVGEGADLLDLARNLTAFFANESCGKCVPCRVGTHKAVTMIEGRDPADLAILPELFETLQQTSICGLGQAALNPILSVLRRFPEAAKKEP